MAEKVRTAVGFQVRTGSQVSEARSWLNSLPVLAEDLVSAGLGDIEVLVEYKLSGNNRRVDAILCGTLPGPGGDSFVVVELKQWSEATLVPGNPARVNVPGVPGRERDHPVDQVRKYCGQLLDHVVTVERAPDRLRGVVYLHNASRVRIDDLYKDTDPRYGLVFSGSERDRFLGFLRSRLAPASGAAAADRLLNSRIRPGRAVTSLNATQVARRRHYRLLDEQQEAFQLALRTVEESRQDDHKRIVVVTGGPGSGKSVIALELLGEFTRLGYGVQHATGSYAFTETMKSVVCGQRQNSEFRSLFGYFSGFGDTRRNDLDVLVCDEAHRIREHSDNWRVRKSLRTGRPQIEELVNAARVPVFLLDENQVVRKNELGSLTEIRKYAEQRGLEVRHVELKGLFRCGGSDTYDAWVRSFLGFSDDPPSKWTDDGAFTLRVADSPSELEQELRRLNEEHGTARITAGFCWKWNKPTEEGRLVRDVVIGDWSMPWNNKAEKPVDGAPPRAFWATDPAGIGQVGCIYTAQGFEYDWAGVILGPDVKVRDGRLTTDNRANKDRGVPRASLSEEQASRFIRNAYKVLLTRALVGTVVYATDPETQAYLKALVPALDPGPERVPSPPGENGEQLMLPGL
ncbi:DNA/RNA helicase domain-containing protein [Nocardiopsis sp. NPDC055824]